MKYTDEKLLEDDLVTILGSIYRKVQWQKMGSKNPWDIFNHRIQFSANEATIPQMIERLCNHLSLQAPVYSEQSEQFVEAVDRCRQVEKEAMHMVRTRTKLLTLLAARYAKVVKATA